MYIVSKYKIYLKELKSLASFYFMFRGEYKYILLPTQFGRSVPKLTD